MLLHYNISCIHITCYSISLLVLWQLRRVFVRKLKVHYHVSDSDSVSGSICADSTVRAIIYQFPSGPYLGKFSPCCLPLFSSRCIIHETHFVSCMSQIRRVFFFSASLSLSGSLSLSVLLYIQGPFRLLVEVRVITACH